MSLKNPFSAWAKAIVEKSRNDLQSDIERAMRQIAEASAMEMRQRAREKISQMAGETQDEATAITLSIASDSVGALAIDVPGGADEEPA